nr:LysR substrate-binding domain-containing protein [Xanthobacteraceae bacterium]
KPNGELRVTTPVGFGVNWLVPRLGEFLDLYPDIRVSLIMSDEELDLAMRQADVAIRVGDGSWPGLAADELLRERLIPVCAPHRLAEFAGRELCELPLIHVVTVSEDWQYWAETTGRKLSPLQIGLRFDMLQMAFDAAAQGLGVAIGRRPLIDTEIRAGRLTPLFEEEAICKSAHWLLSRHTRDDAVQTFRSWMKSRTASAMSN